MSRGCLPLRESRTHYWEVGSFTSKRRMLLLFCSKAVSETTVSASASAPTFSALLADGDGGCKQEGKDRQRDTQSFLYLYLEKHFSNFFDYNSL